MMQGVNQAMQRIAAIERRFLPAPTPGSSPLALGNDFTNVLSDAIQQSTTDVKIAPSGDIAKMVHLAATKYGVDPKLALAVAQAESNLTPDALSPVGAVGVMQLMPETAQALGVRNINDPRENIDGGVHYLKQMLTTFNGDVGKAVAAYNAGPQAVKSHNGIPPYRETREYVARVLALAK